MNGTLLVSRKAYNILKKKSIIEWQSQPFSLDRINSPKDFEIRIVEAAASGKSLSAEFKELNLDWSDRDKIHTCADKMFSRSIGMTDIAWYIDNLNIAIVIESHCSMPNIIEVDSIDALKGKLINYVA